MRLRPLRWWDIDRVVELERHLFPHDPWSAESFWGELADGQRTYLVAESVASADSGEAAYDLVGYAGFACPRSARGGDAELMTVGVAPQAQGGGVGRALVEAVMAAAADRDAGRLVLEVRADNDPAQHLYRRMGFAPIGRRPGYYSGSPGGDPVDALVLAVRLPTPAVSAPREPQGSRGADR